MNRRLLYTGALAVVFATGISAQAQQGAGAPGNQQRPGTTQPGQSPSTQSPTQSQQSQQSRTQTGTATTPQAFVQQVADMNQQEIELARLAQTRATSEDVKDYAEDLIDDHNDALDALRDYAKENNITLRTTSTTSSTSTSQPGTSSSTTRGGQTQGQSSSSTSSTQSAQRGGRDDDQVGSARNPQAGQTRPQGAGQSSTQSSTQSSSQTGSQASVQEQIRELSTKSGTEFDRSWVQDVVMNHTRAIAMLERQQQAKTFDEDLQDLVEDQLEKRRDSLEKAREIQSKLTGGQEARPNNQQNR